MVFFQSVLPAQKSHKLLIWKIAAAALGIALSIAVALAVHRLIDAELVGEAEYAIDRRIANLEDELQRAKQDVRALAAFIESVGIISRRRFDRFAEALDFSETLRAIQWVPIVFEPEREAFIRLAREQGAENFELLDRGPQGGLTPARKRGRHFPIFYVWPLEPNKQAIGLDAMSNPLTAAAIEKASRTEQMTVSGGFSLVQDPQKRTSVILYVPVFLRRQDGERRFAGVAAGILSVHSAVEARAIQYARIVGIRDLSAQPADSLYDGSTGLSTGAMANRTIEVADRQWQVFVKPVIGDDTSWIPWLVLGLGLLLTALAIVGTDQAVQHALLRRLGEEVSAQRLSLDQSERNYRALFHNAGTANCETDVDTGQLLQVNDRMCELFGYRREELLGKTFRDITHPDDLGSDMEELEKLREGDIDTFTAEKRYLRKDGSSFWGLVTARVISDSRGLPQQYTTVIQDITQRKIDEQARSMLVRELAHRVRNTMQLVASLADQTARSATSVETYRGQFQGRLRALTAAQDLLFDTDWSRVPFDRLADRTLAPFLGDEDPPLIEIDVPPVNLTAQQSQTLALALHELAANAVRHGALSVAKGRASLVGHIEHMAEDENVEVLKLAWTETGGPRVRKPMDRGFGLTMLEQALAHQHGGETRLDWHAKGLVFEAQLPLRPDHVS